MNKTMMTAMILSVLNCTQMSDMFNNNGNETNNLYLLAPLVVNANTYNNTYNGVKPGGGNNANGIGSLDSDPVAPMTAAPMYDYFRFYIPPVSGSSYPNGEYLCKQYGASFDIIKISHIKYLMQLINITSKTAGQQQLANSFADIMWRSKSIFVSDTDGLYDPSQVFIYNTVSKVFSIGTKGNVFGVNAWSNVICSDIQ
jgi:hypothetical protein